MTLRSLPRRARRALVKFLFDWSLPAQEPNAAAIRRWAERDHRRHKAHASTYRRLKDMKTAQLRREMGIEA